jgi:hypothetical protein
MNLFNWNKAKTPEPAEPEVKPYTQLRLHYPNGRTVDWSVQPWDGKEDPWRNFLRWFHGRPQSQTFVMLHKNGQTGIIRSNIQMYDIFKKKP